MELGPSAMILESGVERMWSISSRNGLQVRGKVATHGVAIPMRCTPWPEQGAVSGRIWWKTRGIIPGKKRAVLGRVDAIVELHLVQLDLHSDTIILCRMRRALCRRGGQQLPSLSRRNVWISCFIS